MFALRSHWCIALVVVWAQLPSVALANTIKGVRTHEAPYYIRVVLDTSKASKYSIFALDNPHRNVIDDKGAKPASELSLVTARAVS